MKKASALVLLFPLFALAAPPSQNGAAQEAENGKKTGAPPRKSYNQARAAFTGGDLGQAEAGFLSARDQAQADDEVRFRAAFNLALTYAKKAANLKQEKPEEALATLKQSAAWFRDAVHSRPDDRDARHNLELVLRRMQALADELNKGQNSLAARLARVIEDERTLRDRIRGLLGRVNQAGAALEPLQFQSEFEEASTFQRTLLSDAGALLDLSGDERDHLAQRAEKDRSPEDRAKLVQLQNLEHYLNLGRGTMAEVARLLRRLQGDRAHRQTDVAVTELKRAMEQLQDPVTVLKGLTADELAVKSQTGALAELQSRSLQLPVDAQKGPTKGGAPPWLTASLLAEQQKDLLPRTNELLARLEAADKNASAQENSQPADAGEAAKRRRMLEGARQAVPLLKEGISAMEQATGALASERLEPATRWQLAALSALLRALERFSGIRDLIELAYGDQTQLVSLLSPEAKEQLGKLPAAERSTLLSSAVARNLDRLARLRGLFADELSALEADQATQDGSAQNPADKKADPERKAAEKKRYEQAEQTRQLAEAALTRLNGLLAQKGAAVLPAAEQGQKHLSDLRRLFFSIVEHIKDLLRQQTETHDRTSAAQAEKNELERQRKIGPLVDAEAGHANLGKALAEALAAQADQAGKATEPEAKKAQETLAAASEEVKKAQGAMSAAARLLQPDKEEAQSLPVDLEPPLEQEKQAMAHLEAAIRILEPPQENKQQQQNEKQNQEQQISQEQAARRLQAIREREAERQKKKQQPSKPEPVEKDW